MDNKFPHLMPDLESWPIYRLSQDRFNFIKEIESEAFSRIYGKNQEHLGELIEKCIYMENIRIRETPWRVDPPNESLYFKKLQNRLNRAKSDSSSDEVSQVEHQILSSLIHRYTDEIVGTFKITTFLFARKFLTFMFSRLLRTKLLAGISLNAGEKLRRRLKIEGEVEAMRNLLGKGTVVVVPTHFSNLDSILIGYVLDSVAGMPGFSYGAGLNLFNNGIAAFFMNRLGAYRLDRRKKNPIYLETLKSMSYSSLLRGTNTIFFPGGTRSRSGALEDKLKLGLLGSTIEAQRKICENKSDEKIFVVPIVLGYHFVLEAQTLIDQHLKLIGKEKFQKNKHSRIGIRSILKYIFNLYWQGSEIIVSVGKPMDVLGNPVNAEGISLDPHGNQISVVDYFKLFNQVEPNAQREVEYTRQLSESITKEFHKANIVLSSYLVAFAAFQYLKQEYKAVDFFNIFRLPVEDFFIPRQSMLLLCDQLRSALFKLKENGLVEVSYEFDQSINDLVDMGIGKLGVFHRYRPLKTNKTGDIVSEDFHLLYYYHNKLLHYNLENAIDWKTIL